MNIAKLVLLALGVSFGQTSWPATFVLSRTSPTAPTSLRPWNVDSAVSIKAVHDTADTVRAYVRARISDSLATNSRGWASRSQVHDTADTLRAYTRNRIKDSLANFLRLGTTTTASTTPIVTLTTSAAYPGVALKARATNSGTGVLAEASSNGAFGLEGDATVSGAYGIYGYAPVSGAVAVAGYGSSGGLAGKFTGPVTITGTTTLATSLTGIAKVASGVVSAGNLTSSDVTTGLGYTPLNAESVGSNNIPKMSTSPNYATQSLLSDNGADLVYTGANGATITALAGTGTRIVTVASNGQFGSTTRYDMAGVTDGSSVGSGIVGEYVESKIPTGSAVSLTRFTNGAITSISLTAGDWDVSGLASFNSSWSGPIFNVSINTSVAQSTDGTEISDEHVLLSAGYIQSVPVSAKRFSITSTTTVYLVAKVDAPSGTGTGFGYLRARRVR